jgi:hypothetical protein
LYRRAVSLAAVTVGALAVLPAATAGAAANFSVSQHDLVFDFVPVGVTSAAQTVTVVNNGDAPGTLGAVTIGNPHGSDFLFSADGCSGATLSPGATCAFGVRFRPTANGTRVGHARIPAPNDCDLWVTLAGSGTGAPAPRARAAACTVTTPGATTLVPGETRVLPGSVTVVPGQNTVTTRDRSSSSTSIRNRNCNSRRRIAVTLRKRRGVQIRRVTATFRGKPVRVRLAKGRWRAQLDMRGARPGRYRFVAKIQTAGGRTLTETRRYSACVPQEKR